MADSRRSAESSSGSTLVLSAFAGAVVGAAGLAWWLLSEADRRRQNERQRRLVSLSRLQEWSSLEESGALAARRPDPVDPETIAEGPLRDRVLQLNRAIDEVRRQLEQLQTHP